jgi:hypothetical protein
MLVEMVNLSAFKLPVEADPLSPTIAISLADGTGKS